MTYREKSAWLMIGVLGLAYAWYLTSVVAHAGGRSVGDIAYQQDAIFASIVVVALMAISHIVIAATGKSGHAAAYAAIKRYARSAGAVVVSAAAAMGMALAMVEADYFWIANVILAGLVIAELASAGSEILIYRKGA